MAKRLRDLEPVNISLHDHTCNLGTDSVKGSMAVTATSFALNARVCPGQSEDSLSITEEVEECRPLKVVRAPVALNGATYCGGNCETAVLLNAGPESHGISEFWAEANKKLLENLKSVYECDGQ